MVTFEDVQNSPEIRELILSSIGTMMEDKNNIQFFDWSICLKIFNLAAIDSSEYVVSSGFSLFRLLTLRTFEGENKEVFRVMADFIGVDYNSLYAFYQMSEEGFYEYFIEDGCFYVDKFDNNTTLSYCREIEVTE